MRKAIKLALGLLFAASLYGQITVREPIPQNVVIEVNAADVAGEPIPRTIFGPFLERIGNSTYNGPWAKLLINPSLESGMWTPQKISDMLHEPAELRQAGDLALPLPWYSVVPRCVLGSGRHYGPHAAGIIRSSAVAEKR